VSKSKDKEIIRYVEREEVEKYMQPTGFVPAGADIQLNVKFDKRGNLEEDESKLQIIPYVVLTYDNDKHILTYLRSGSEQRLLGKMSIGFGGHSNKKDNDILDTAIREIQEELSIATDESRYKHIGYIFSNNTPVSKVHIGYVYTYELLYGEVASMQVSDEIALAVFQGKQNLQEASLKKWSNIPMEDWSEILLKNI
jgi:predicted NUDIX family phosphoesterase